MKRQLSISNESVSTSTSNPVALDLSYAPQGYHQLLHGRPQAIAFLFGDIFANTLLVAVDEVATKYQVDWLSAIEEFRRLLALKVFAEDHDAQKISPTPLSTLP